VHNLYRNDSCVKAWPYDRTSHKPTFVLFVERTIAASAAERMRLGVALTGMGNQKGVHRTQSKRTHPKEDVPM
jgi:hypothetical protein